MNGYIQSIQTLGTLDGPGIRFVLFMQGCPLRCVCCHNPETWEIGTGSVMSPEDVLSKVLKYRHYFGHNGGITVSGGEPLLQPEFVFELFSLCKNHGISTALDTSGCIMNKKIKKLLSVTDLVLLDYKMTNKDDYKKYTGASIDAVNNFLQYLEDNSINTWIRQVVIKDITDSEENALFLKELKNKYSYIQKIELLPFHKMCVSKYDELKIDFPLKNTDETSDDTIQRLYRYINSNTE